VRRGRFPSRGLLKSREQSIVSVRLNIRKLKILSPDGMGEVTASTQDVRFDVNFALGGDGCVEGTKFGGRASNASVGKIIDRVNSYISSCGFGAGVKDDLEVP